MHKLLDYSSSLLKDHPFCNEKLYQKRSSLSWGVQQSSILLSQFIWPNKWCGLWWEWPHKRGTIATVFNLMKRYTISGKSIILTCKDIDVRNSN